MSILKTIILGIIQGLTEFLPISSSGHLVLLRDVLDFQTGLLTFEVLLHFGTGLAVVFVFWRDIQKLFKFKDPENRHFLYLLIVGVIPTGIIGLLFEDYVESLFGSPILVGLMLLVTGVILYLSSFLNKGSKSIRDISFLDAILIGLAQGVAVIPGISRSGTTIVAALSRNINRELAAKYSFLLSLPVIFGAGLLRSKVLFASVGKMELLPLFMGAFVAMIVGYFAIKLLNKLIAVGRLHYFSYYCWSIGLLVILRNLFNN